MPRIDEELKYSVTVSSRPARGRFRAGFKFTREESAVHVGEKGLRMIQDDPELVVHKIEDYDPEAEETIGGPVSTDMNAAEAIEQIGKLKTVEAVAAFVTEAEKRKTVIEAAEERKAGFEK